MDTPFCQFGAKDSLRSICQGLLSATGNLVHLGVSSAPTKSTLSYNHENRSYELFEKFFHHIIGLYHAPNRRIGQLARIKAQIKILDSTTISLCIKVFDWARYRKTKGAIKMHTLIDYDFIHRYFYLCLMSYLNRRPRRNRISQAVRNLAEETTLLPQNLVFPLFLLPGENKKEAISSMPGISRLSLDLLLKEVEQCMKMGVQAFDVFPCVPDELKNQTATYSYAEDNFYLDALSQIKQRFPESWLMTDVAMDPYSSDGHDGLVENGHIVNDKTLEILGKMAIAQAQAGADVLGPSDMMDGRVGFLRETLDKAGFTQVSIMSYTAKYASGFYGPFREALNSAPKFGDKKTYQMNPANVKEALLEAQLDFDEGADMMMVKPAMCYLDVIKTLADQFPIPIAAYQVSGEFSMLHAAAQNGWLDLERVMVESLTSIRRAGAQVILSYFAKDYARWYKTTRS